MNFDFIFKLINQSQFIHFCLNIWTNTHLMLKGFILIFFVGIILFILEYFFPAQKLPHVQKWWRRVTIINLLQLIVVILGGYTWEIFFQKHSFLYLTKQLGLASSVWIAYLIITFVYYFWHRVRHTNFFLWNTLHQLHHSPQRLETITSFYKHPLEIITNSILISGIIYSFLGLTSEAGMWITVLTCYAEFFYHMNLKTPHWIGYFIQRPESHRFHHQRGKHFNNFADLPIWDMIFGTFYNPKNAHIHCGFKSERELKFCEILLFRNVNAPTQKNEDNHSQRKINQ